MAFVSLALLIVSLGRASCIGYNPNFFKIPLVEGRIVAEPMMNSVCGDRDHDKLSVREICSLPPDRGSGVKRDIIRIYFNPVVQHCLPFSWSGEGGNANRFISIKNCYEICHPADPGIRRMSASGIKAHLVPRRGPQCPEKPEMGKEGAEDVIVRQLPHPADKRKTLTLVQPVKYVRKEEYAAAAGVTTVRPRFFIEQHVMHGPVYVPAPLPCEPNQGYLPPSYGQFNVNNGFNTFDG